MLYLVCTVHTFFFEGGRNFWLNWATEGVQPSTELLAPSNFFVVNSAA